METELLEAAEGMLSAISGMYIEFVDRSERVSVAEIRLNKAVQAARSSEKGVDASKMRMLSEPALLLETVEMRIAFLEQQKANTSVESAARAVYYHSVLADCVRQRTELISIFTRT